jgi:hypothetical protein
VNRACGGRLAGPLARGAAVLDCVERRRRFEAGHADASILTPFLPRGRWLAILPFGVLPDDGTALGANSLCALMDKLDSVYPPGG